MAAQTILANLLHADGMGLARAAVAAAVPHRASKKSKKQPLT